MSEALLNHVTAETAKRKVPVLEPGYTVRVHQKIKEGSKERIQVFEGLVIRISSGNGVNKTFTVRRIVEGIGVEKIFPVYSPNVEKVEVVKKGKVRRAKLYYMRERQGKSARLREEDLGEVEMVGVDQKLEEAAVEEVVEAPAPVETTPAENAE